ncbi:MAG: hypothetical protein CMH48_11415 [Muricauda sp.]|nr:LuxR C-terminal-related transcriptional regulator [Allomuricauda sp.]MBC31440.1 hypothetical protein [Allomuricauda sp.]|tara:strand:- start:2611 stop:3285 length:675 start_codon:yes stop_codon:yes gene_type:complete
MQKALIVEDEPLLCGIYQDLLRTLHKENRVPLFSTTACQNYREAIYAIEEINKNGKTLNFCILDFRLSQSRHSENENGLSIGLLIKKVFPECRILIITSLLDNYILRSVLQSLKPTGFLIKSDINLEDLKKDICSVLDEKTVYSAKVTNYLKQTRLNSFVLDNRDLKLIHLLDKGYTLPEIADKIGLSLSGIEYRKRRIASKLGATSANISDLLDYIRDELKII